MTPASPSINRDGDHFNRFSRSADISSKSKSVFNFVNEAESLRPIKIADGIKLVYVGERRWSVEGLDYPTIKVDHGQELLASRKFKDFRNALAERLGIGLDEIKKCLRKTAKRIDEHYARLQAEERNAEMAEELIEEKPSWMLNAKLLEEARKWVKERLEEIRRQPYPDRIHSYHELLKECLKDILAGEDSNKVNAYVIIGFGSNYILLLLGRSSIGKNLLVDTIIVLVPYYRRNRWTTHVPSYLDPEEVKDKVLYIRELPGIEEELGNFLKAIEEVDGRILFSTDCVKRNPITGELEVETHKVPVKAFISTSNREDVHIPGLMERTFLIRMDDSIEQDRRVAEYVDRINRQREKIKLGLIPWTDRDWSLARVYWLHRFALSVEDDILLPYEDLSVILTEKLGSKFPNEIRRIVKRARMYLVWFGRCFAQVLPKVEFQGKQYRVLDPETLKIALNYFMDLIHHKEEFKKPKLLRFAERMVSYFMERGLTGVVHLGKEERKALGTALGLSEGRIRQYLNMLERPDVASFAVTSHYEERHRKVWSVDLEQLFAWVSEWVQAETTITEDDFERLKESFESFLSKLGLSSNIADILSRQFSSTRITGGERVFPEDNRCESMKSKIINSHRVIPGKNLGEPSDRVDENRPRDIDTLLKGGAERDVYEPFGEPSEKTEDLHEELLPIPKPDYDHCSICLGSDGVELLELAGHKIPVCYDKNCRRIFRKIESLVEFIESRGGVVDYKTLENAGLMRTAMLCRSLCSVVKTDGFRYWIKRGR